MLDVDVNKIKLNNYIFYIQQPSGVKISDMTYQDIHGSSATEVVVKFDCSPMYPCFVNNQRWLKDLVGNDIGK